MSKYETLNFINNEYVKGTGGKTFSLKSPVTEEEVGLIHAAGPKDVDEAVAYAEKAFKIWSAKSGAERSGVIHKFADLLEGKAQELAEADAAAIGRPLAGNYDTYTSLQMVRFVGSQAETVHGSTTLNTPGLLGFQLAQPYGVTCGIVPWNFPVYLTLAKIIPAVAAGNSIIIKTSEKAPFAVSQFGALIKDAGFPAGLIQILHGKGDVGQLLSEHLKIRKISFTGSTRTGRAIMTAAAQSNLKTVTLELGGKSPTVIFNDANIEQAVQDCHFSASYNAGQMCMASTRLYVQEGIYDQFTKAFAAKYGVFKHGAAADKETTLGPVADDMQRDIVSRYLEIGKKDGKVLTGGNKASGKGNFFEPTIFTDVPHDSRINKEEVFGPVVVVHKFKTEEEACELANDSEYGLYAAVYTKDLDRAVRVSKSLEAGSIGVNCNSPTFTFDQPFGGHKQSGVGYENGLSALDPWLERKSVYVKVAPSKTA